MKPEVLMRLTNICGETVALDLNRASSFLMDDDKSLATRRVPRVAGRIAVIPVQGVLSQYGGWVSQSMDRTYRMARACVENADIGGVILNFDTPGGTSHGCMENARKLRELSSEKPIVGIANSLAASAGYWMLSACSTVVATPGADVGSIGVYVLYQNWQKALSDAGIDMQILRAGEHKIEMNPFEEMTSDIRERAMVGVEECYRNFTSDVAEYRGITRQKVLSDFGKGLTFGAKKAAEIGMVDKVMEFDQMVTSMMKTSSGKKSANASGDELSQWLCDVVANEKKEATEQEYQASVDTLRRRLSLRRRQAT